MNKNPVRFFWMILGFLCGAWNGGDCPADPAHGSFLHGDGVLLCKKLRAASSLVSGNAVIQEASGELCGKEDNDFKDQVFHCGNGDGSDDSRLSHDETGACRQDLPGSRVALPCGLFLWNGKDRGGRRK